MPTKTQLELILLAGSGARPAALFASALQPSDTPAPGLFATAIRSALQRFGPRGCTERMAQEFGDHPDAAAQRMRWAGQLAAQHAAPPPARPSVIPTPSSRREDPHDRHTTTA